MRTVSFVLAAFALLSATSSLALAADTDPATCHTAKLATVRTDFPVASQSRGEHGTVQVKVTIMSDGRATNTQVAQSSGYPALDTAAADSVARYWRFDVTQCAATQLPSESFVTVQFERAVRYTLSGTINARAAKNTAQNTDRCDTASNAAGDQIVTCLAAPAHVPPKDQTTLANRTDATQRN